jgi:hypothetical protein
MFDFKQIITSLIVALVVVIGAGLIGDNQSVGGGTRFPSGLSADGTLPSTGEVRGTSMTTYNPTATSSTYVHSGASSVGGQLIVEDTDGAGCSAITALNGAVVVGTVTCP